MRREVIYAGMVCAQNGAENIYRILSIGPVHIFVPVPPTPAISDPVHVAARPPELSATLRVSE